ncbi:Hypothetical predicted protein [Lecanosticta acicola]|uniref:Uncharacterized protein n=1 Tax=Lecanosticta acicola TaxID=111012 RepID=A0AAI9EA67_9PEZI|nr:Hypothetical predicted protein [Lecanosticta acicola]
MRTMRFMADEFSELLVGSRRSLFNCHHVEEHRVRSVDDSPPAPRSQTFSVGSPLAFYALIRPVYFVMSDSAALKILLKAKACPAEASTLRVPISCAMKAVKKRSVGAEAARETALTRLMRCFGGSARRVFLEHQRPGHRLVPCRH